jgi:hypothetical protein
MTRYAIGDLQCSFDKFIAVLENHKLLDGSKRLREEVELLSIGDYFDYHDKESDDLKKTHSNGIRILEWLAGHESSQVTIILGNHDSARVQELISFSDEGFAEARSLALDWKNSQDPKTLETFFQRYPELPNPDIALRDFSSYGQAQRELVISLLLNKRLRLGHAESIQGQPVLVNHAGVTHRELKILGLEHEREPATIAKALDKMLYARVERVAAAWSRGERPALDLAPLHVSGVTKEEGGGLLYHRPTNPEFYTDRWAFSQSRPRRYDPACLPRGLAQVVGHTTHKKCCQEFGDWIPDGAKNANACALRSMRVGSGTPDYRLQLPSSIMLGENEALMIMIDAAINDAKVEEYPLLQLD